MTFLYIFNSIGETRGIGGIFFDDLDKEPQSDCYNFVEVSFKTEKIDTIKKKQKIQVDEIHVHVFCTKCSIHTLCMYIFACINIYLA